MPGEVKRSVRVAERVRQELSLLLTHEVRDPRVEGVVVSRVEMPDDLRSAKVYVRLLPRAEGPISGADPRRAEALEGLTRASSLFRREVARRAKLKFAPTFKFVYDEGQDKAMRIEELLAEVEADRRKG